MKQKHIDSGSPKTGTPETHGDGVLKDLAAKATALAPSLTTDKTGDPRRRGEIKIEGDDDVFYLYIEGEMWAEVEWSWGRKAWCIQDCMGHCLSHIEHLHAEVSDGTDNYRALKDKALEKAKQMIRDGSMPSPEDAKNAFELREKGK